ncbi:hypothetical protein GCM10009000_027540 [Halobacterium noricense]
MSGDGSLADFGAGTPVPKDNADGDAPTEDADSFADRDGPECVDCGRSTPTTAERPPYGEVLCPRCWLKREGLK